MLFINMVVRPQYSKEQRTFMVLTYNRTNNVQQARDAFVQQFSGARHPSYNTVVKNSEI